MAYLLDSDTLIENLRNSARVRARLIEKASIPKAISVITYGELLYGAKVSKQAEKNLAIIRGLPDIFPIVGIGRSIMETFIDIKRNLEVEGRPLDDMDLLIAATALTLNYCLVTNNIRHFGRVAGLDLENWME